MAFLRCSEVDNTADKRHVKITVLNMTEVTELELYLTALDEAKLIVILKPDSFMCPHIDICLCPSR